MKTFTTFIILLFVVRKVELRAEFLQTVIAHTPLGGLAGMRIKTDYDINNTVSDTYDIFRGIPFALPPVNDKRFQPPVPVQPWYDIKSATDHGPVCPQTEIWIDPKWPQDEDCLYLSVYSPYEYNKSDHTYPVIMFIHGGSYEVGTERLYEGGLLSLQGVVVVMINYRLGILGFLTSGEGTIKGNYGLLDQIQALKWIQENIRSFRGDPNNVTIMGQSVGSSSVGLLLTSPLANGLYHRAIMQSGAVLARYSYQTTKSTNITEHFLQVGTAHGCPPTNVAGVQSCLLALPWKSFIYNRHQLPRNDPVIPEFRPFIDGYVLPLEPERWFQSEGIYTVPILQGVVKDEMSPYIIWDKPILPTSDLGPMWDIYEDRVDPIKTSIFNYLEALVGPDFIQLVENAYSEWNLQHGYMLKFTRIIEDIDFVVPTVQLSELISDSFPVYQYYFAATENSYHLVDLNYVFGSPYSGRDYDDGYGSNNYSTSDKLLSKRMMELWGNFAKTGTAFIGNKTYTPYNTHTKLYIHIKKDSNQVGWNLKAHSVDFWTKIIPNLTQLIRSDNKKSNSGTPCMSGVNSGFYDTPCGKQALGTVILGLLSSLLFIVCVGLIISIGCRKKSLMSLRHIKAENV